MHVIPNEGMLSGYFYTDMATDHTDAQIPHLHMYSGYLSVFYTFALPQEVINKNTVDRCFEKIRAICLMGQWPLQKEKKSKENKTHLGSAGTWNPAHVNVKWIK